MGPAEMAARIQARQERYNSLRSTTTMAQAQSMSALARENPSLSPGVLFAAGRGGIQPGTPASAALSQGQERLRAEIPMAQAANSGSNPLKRAISWSYRSLKLAAGKTPVVNRIDDVAGSVAGGIKGISRGTWIGASAPAQTLQGAIRSARAEDGDFGLRDVLSPSNWTAGYRQTDLYAADTEIEENGGYLGLLTGDTDVDYGSGFFVGGNVGVRAGEAKQSSTTERIGGKLPTYGRLLGSEIGLEPGGVAFNLVSGLADGAVALTADPLSYTAAPVRAVQASRQFAGSASRGFDAEGVARAIDERLMESRRVATPAAVATDEAVETVSVVPQTADEIAAEMGALKGIRETVDSDRVLEYLTTNRRGQQLVEVLSESTDFAKMWDATKGKIDPQTLLALTSREMTGDEVIEILGPTLGRTARTAEMFGVDATGRASVGMGGLGTLATAKFKQRVRDTRIFGTVPERVLPKNDVPEQLRNASDFLRNAKITDADSLVVDGRAVTRGNLLRRFAEVNGGEGMYEVAKDMMALGAKKAMDEFNIDTKRAHDLFKMYGNSTSDARKFWVQRIVANGEAAYVNRAFNVTDELIEGDDDAWEIRALPHLASQFLDNNIPLPDPREIRAGLSRWSGVLGNRQGGGKIQQAYNKPIELSENALRVITDDIFKPLVLLRPAFILRNQIDEQFRPAAAGLHSLFSHPVSYLQWMLTDSKGVGKLLASRTPFASRGDTDILGEGFDEFEAGIRTAKENLDNAKRSGDAKAVEQARAALKTARQAVRSVTPYTDAVSAHARAVTGGVGNWRNRTAEQVKDSILYARNDAEYSRAMGEGLHLLYNDPLAKRIARGDDLDELKSIWWRGPLQKFRTDLAQQGERMSYLLDEIGAAQYVDDTVEFMRAIVGESPELRRAAATGRIGGVPLTDGDTLKISQNALDQLDGLKQVEGFQGPTKVLGSRLIRGTDDGENAYRRATNSLFYALNDVPVRKLSKSPVFRQRYYRRIEQLIGFVDDAGSDRIIDAARRANLSRADVKRLQAKRGAPGRMSFVEADKVAKADALEFTEELFYSLHHRGQFFDVLRLVFPFGEVFLDSARKYSQLTARNPVIPYRITQVINAARDADVNGDGKGFFYTDEQTGEEMFAFPGSEKMLSLLGQQGAGQLRAPVQNLNILGTTVIPGFGPVVQIAAASMLPDEPDFNAVRELISPFGERTLEGGAIESFLPSWFNKFRTAELIPFLDANPEQQRAFVNTQKDWMGYLASTGEYNLQDVADQERLMQDAKSKARTTFLIRGMAQSIAPSPPSPEFVAFDKDGKLQTQFRLAEEYRRIQKEQKELGTPEATNRVFIETFGEQAVLAVVPNTKAAEGKSPIPPNREALEFFQANKAAAERFPTVFGLFAPDPDGAEFDFVAYNRQIEAGERVVISPEEAVRRANSNVARMIYTQATQMAEAASPLNEFGKPKVSKENREILSQLKAKLSEDFPGYSASFENDIPGAIEDLKRASADPQLGKTPAAEGLRIWLQARDMAEDAAQAQFGVGWRQADRARSIRDSMRVLGDRLSADFPGFSNLYERVLEREMARDT
jgi:hypothetical protein